MPAHNGDQYARNRPTHNEPAHKHISGAIGMRSVGVERAYQRAYQRACQRACQHSISHSVGIQTKSVAGGRLSAAATYPQAACSRHLQLYK